MIHTFFASLYSFVVNVACLTLVVWVMLAVVTTMLGKRRG